jgi:hypothetical protein
MTTRVKLDAPPAVNRLRAWAEVFFDELWRLIPAQPILFPFFFIGAALTLLCPPAAPVAMTGIHLVTWSVLALVTPALVLAAWWMIVRKTGFTRYLGFYFRFGGDIGQLVVLATYIASWSNAPVYALVILVGVAAFVTVLVVRDIMALVLVENVASRLYRESQEDAAKG